MKKSKLPTPIPIRYALSLAALALGFSVPANANIFYVELAGGLSSFQNGSPLFGVGAPTASQWSYAYNSSFFMTLGDGKNPLDIQFGVQGRFSNGWYTTDPSAPNNSNTTNYSVVAAYPMVRLQLSKIYLGLGATPFLWKHSGIETGLPLDNATGSIAAIGEAGLLWAVTPEFSLGLGAAGQWFSTGGSLGPAPFLDLTASMRFYFGSAGKWGSGESVSKSGSNEFKGWRYPFGYMK